MFKIIHSKTASCKKGAVLCKMASMKKVVKYRWRPRMAVMVGQ